MLKSFICVLHDTTRELWSCDHSFFFTYLFHWIYGTRSPGKSPSFKRIKMKQFESKDNLGCKFDFFFIEIGSQHFSSIFLSLINILFFWCIHPTIHKFQTCMLSIYSFSIVLVSLFLVTYAPIKLESSNRHHVCHNRVLIYSQSHPIDWARVWKVQVLSFGI